MFIDEHISQLFSAATEHAMYDDLSDSDKVEYRRDWMRLAERAGMRRFKIALARALQHHSLPQASDIDNYMPPPHGIDRRNPHDPDCAVCGGTGWRKVQPTERFRAAKVRRCKGVEV